MKHEPIPDRECGGCTMCCKVFPIPETGKGDFDVCPHARPGEGCAKHAERPQTCRDFFCIWRLDASLGDEWRPDVAGFVLHDPEPWDLLLSLDAAAPDAWRRQPYEPDIRAWAKDVQQRGRLMGARAGNRVRLILKDREVDIDG